MSSYLLFWILGILLGLTAYVSYFRAIFQKETKPHLYTWILWWTLASMAAIVAVKNHAGWGILVPCLMALCNATIAFLALKYGETKLTKKDMFLLTCAGLTMLLWWTTQDDLLAIILVVTIDMIGFYFTWKKCYYRPYEENITSYIIWTVELGCAFLAIEHLTLINWFYSGFLAVIEWFFVVFLIWRRKVTKK